MRGYYYALGMALSLAACQSPGEPFATDSSVAEAQAKLATDPAQAELWQQAAENDSAAGITDVPVPDEPVIAPSALTIADQPAEMARVPFPVTMDSGIVIVAVPDQMDKFAGTASITAVEGEFLTLDLGGKGNLVVQAKVRGGPLRASVGDKGQVSFRQGDPFRRNDMLMLKLPNDALLYEVVGGQKPVRLSSKTFGLSAHQLTVSESRKLKSVPQPNSTALRLSLDGESRVLVPGEQANFGAAKMTVKLLSSLAVEGESANAIEGDPYRVELFGWRTP